MPRWGLIFVLGLMFSQAAFAQTPDRVTVRGVRAYGRGCPMGTISAAIAPDGRSFTLIMDNYLATAGDQRPIDRKDCDIQIDLDIPGGWRYAIVGADYRGFVDVDAGAIATHQVIYSYDGRRPVNEAPGFENGNGYAFRATEFRGPQSRDYFIQNNIEMIRAPKSPCSFGGAQTLYMTTFLMARTQGFSRGQAASISLDTVDGAVSEQQFRLAWFRCDRFAPRPPEPPTPGPGPRPPRPPRNPPPPFPGGRWVR